MKTKMKKRTKGKKMKEKNEEEGYKNCTAAELLMPKMSTLHSNPNHFNALLPFLTLLLKLALLPS